MVKKLRKMADEMTSDALGKLPTGLLDGQLAQTIKDSAQQIWLAGLGAFAKAQGEGNKVFDTLMKEGANLHRKSQSVQAAAEGKLGDVAGRMSAMAGAVAGEVGSKANAQWDKLESIFEERTARALSRLGVPTAKEVAALAARVEELAAAVAALGGASPAPGLRRVPVFKPGKALKDAVNLAPAEPAAPTKAGKAAARSAPRKTAAAAAKRAGRAKVAKPA